MRCQFAAATAHDQAPKVVSARRRTAEMLGHSAASKTKMNQVILLPSLLCVSPSFYTSSMRTKQQADYSPFLYMREALTIAQILGLHRESYYVKVDPKEQQIRRRTLWLLFVAERYEYCEPHSRCFTSVLMLSVACRPSQFTRHSPN